MSATKCGPLSEEILKGTPNHDTISLSKIFPASLAWLVRHGKASGYPVKVSTNTNRYLNPPFLGSSVKSICQCSPGVFLGFVDPS